MRRPNHYSIRLISSISSILLSFFFGSINTVYAQAITSDQQNQLTALLKAYGQEVKTATNFYLAGTPCHQNQLDRIVYISNQQYMYLYFNDSLGNCTLASINIEMKPADNVMPGGCLCQISDSVYNEIYTSWSLGALEKFDATQKPNPGFRELSRYVHNCLISNVVQISAVINQLNKSKQVAGQSSQ